eukprot:COSAG02_NODE_4330_length_5495_cov_21.736471_6_plen_127_part_00
MGIYESWARQLLPTVPFPDFVTQLERLSSNGKVQMKQMQIEQGHEDWAADEDIDNVSNHSQAHRAIGLACLTARGPTCTQVDANASTAQDDWGDAGGGGVNEFGVDLDHEVSDSRAATPRSACRIS